MIDLNSEYFMVREFLKGFRLIRVKLKKTRPDSLKPEATGNKHCKINNSNHDMQIFINKIS